MDSFLEEIKRSVFSKYGRIEEWPILNIGSKPSVNRNLEGMVCILRAALDTVTIIGTTATQGRSITSMAAYEGQSGSKDRGDPEVHIVKNPFAHYLRST